MSHLPLKMRLMLWIGHFMRECLRLYDQAQNWHRYETEPIDIKNVTYPLADGTYSPGDDHGGKRQITTAPHAFVFPEEVYTTGSIRPFLWNVRKQHVCPGEETRKFRAIHDRKA